VQEPQPVLPTPTNRVAPPIAEPEAAKPRKAGAAKGKAKDATRKKPKVAASKAKDPAVKGSKRKAKSGR
jgi:hypothetical protein